MTDVHEALKTLSPTDHAEFPSDPSALNLHLATSLADAHILISSIPPPALPAGVTLPESTTAEIAELQKEWKPVKINAKENPYGISVFKLAAKDGKGTWFARRSVHTDIPFQRFKAGLQQEFQQPTVEETEGSQQSGPVRGIGKDVLIHHETCELGKAEIFQLSAQFPGPSARRDFVEGCFSSSAHPADISAAATDSGGVIETEDTDQPRPKQFTMISKPVLNHPEGDQRSGYVRGYYESVEFIREVPSIGQQLTRTLSTPNILSAESFASTTRPRGKTISEHSGEVVVTPENCPVDWIMITRSDPGGSVPKWMVERGTPGGIVKDAQKFIEWCRQAKHLDDTPESSVLAATKEQEQGARMSQDSALKAHTQQHLAERGGPAAAVLTPTHGKAELSPARHDTQNDTQNNGLFTGALNTVAAGMTSLAQSAMPSTTTPPPSDGGHSRPPSVEDVSDDDTASLASFATADSSPEHPSRTPSVTSTASNAHLSAEERALQQFLKEKQKLDEKLKKEESRRTEREKKIAEKHMKSMEKQEQKYRRALEKANEKRRKEEEKREKELQKKLEREERGKRAEIEELKKIVEGLTKDNLALRARIEVLEGKGKVEA